MIKLTCSFIEKYRLNNFLTGDSNKKVVSIYLVDNVAIFGHSYCNFDIRK